jgi:DNA helicase-2/ATP-dependent DNA helicase PcrA
MDLRPAQARILDYRGGRLAVSAVPGSGKTFILSLLAAELITAAKVDVNQGQQVLVVTYLNASVDTFRARTIRRLEELNLAPLGFDVRTLHSLALEIVRLASGGLGSTIEGPVVADETQSASFLALAVDGWIEDNSSFWRQFLPDDTPASRVRWRDVTEETARSFIRVAKNERYHSEDIIDRLQDERRESVSGELQGNEEGDADFRLLWMLAGIYQRYQAILSRQGALDFDDLIWQAADHLAQRPDLAAALRQRWPYVLEDEAQDSVPLQEVLLEALTGPEGNWVRVGDPNQAITSTFTAAHPRHFMAFMRRRGVDELPLPNSGRCAPVIYEAANRLVHWTCDEHPVPEVREYALRRQDILPTPPGDAQPNPSDAEAAMTIRVYRHREDEELPAVASLAVNYTQDHPADTIAILVPTNETGRTVAEHLDALNASYDDLLRGGSRQREIAEYLHSIVAVLANPADARRLVDAYAVLRDLEHPALGRPVQDWDHLQALLRSVYRPETLLYPADPEELADALPSGVADDTEVASISRFVEFLRQALSLRHLPIDDLILSLSDQLFATNGHSDQGLHENDLAIAYQTAHVMRQWHDLQPDWRLPELSAQLADVAAGRRRLPFGAPNVEGYEPEPGRISLSTQHGAKGMEWDAVFLVGVDGFWVPGTLDAPFLGVREFLGGDPSAEAAAQLRYLMKGDAGLFPGRTATESAHIEVIGERLRLLYVGITRARRFLQLSRSRATRRYEKEYDAAPATVIGVLYRYLEERESS